MTHESFTEWVEIACTALGSGDRFRETLLANADVFIEDWHATLPELGDCLHRLVAEGRVPKWPNELTNAIRTELDTVRMNRRILNAPAARDESCKLCGGSGIVVVPHPLCIYQGRMAPYYNPRTKEARKNVYSTGVICTGHVCHAGNRERDHENQRCNDPVEVKKRPRLRNLEEYSILIGEDLDGVAMWREYSRRLAAESRHYSPRTAGERTMYDGILKRLAVVESVE